MYASSQLIRAKEQGRTDPRIPIPIEDGVGDPDSKYMVCLSKYQSFVLDKLEIEHNSRQFGPPVEKSHQLTINEDLIAPEKFLRLKGCLENKSNGTEICDELLKEMDPILRLPPAQVRHSFIIRSSVILYPA